MASTTPPLQQVPVTTERMSMAWYLWASELSRIVREQQKQIADLEARVLALEGTP